MQQQHGASHVHPIFRTSKQKCPTCYEILDAHTAIDDDDPRPPQPGDVTVCFYCGVRLKLERMTPAELWQLRTDDFGTYARLKDIQEKVLYQKRRA
jgi:hypothetical protein